jgi:hypothetical protein
MRRSFHSHGPMLAAVAALTLSGCTALTRDVLVNEAGRPRSAMTTHCSGSEWTDNSMIAVVPLPIISYASPTQEINEIKPDDVLARCGPLDRLSNRKVEVDRGWCVPTAITRLLTLGIWHWCPAEVTWDADVSVPTTAGVPPAPQAEPRTSYQPVPVPGAGS